MRRWCTLRPTGRCSYDCGPATLGCVRAQLSRRAPHTQAYVRSAAILHATASVSPTWLWVICYLLLFIPAVVRDTIYKQARSSRNNLGPGPWLVAAESYILHTMRCLVQVARNRIRLFGAKDTCRRATKEDKRHFLE